MDIQINYEHRKNDLNKTDFDELCKYILKSEKCPNQTEMSLSFVTDEKIHALNRKYRNIDRPTDVLSFPCDELSDYKSNPDNYFDLFEIGDIVIAVDIAERQSCEYDNTFEEELIRLVVHGLLHLCGYDHVKDSDAKIMEKRECDLIASWYKQ